MLARRKELEKILLASGAIKHEDLDRALLEQREGSPEIERNLPNKGILKEKQLMPKPGFMPGIPYVQIGSINFDPGAVSLLPPHLIRLYRILPISRHSSSLIIAMSDPLNQQAIDDVRMATGMDVIPVLAREKELDIAIRHYLAFRLDPGMKKILNELKQNKELVPWNGKELNMVKIEDDAPTIRLVNAVLYQAVEGRCSDIHIEPREEASRVRFRVDGDLLEVINLPKNSLPAIVSRIKIISGMDITEKRLPQDGHFRMNIDGQGIDFRVSSLPTVHGEKIAIRILDQSNILTRIEELGLSKRNQERLLYLAHLPYGLILVTGPTGSGKTTTLYSMLEEINSADKNIITLEDPIEYSLDGINQVQINSKAKLSFASGLRSILRQDPDIIMVGEIRDIETAELAIQAALTGHLVLSTLHTNSAVGSIARLRDIGLENFLLASCLGGVISQRLVRCLCSNCKQQYRLEEETAISLGIPEESGNIFYRPSGCNICRNLGYQGRIALQEIMLIGSELRSLISRGKWSENYLQQICLQEGMISIKDDGITKARMGVTSLEEVMKVVLIGS